MLGLVICQYFFVFFYCSGLLLELNLNCNLASIDVSRLTLLDSIEMKVPTVFNSTVPHRVVCDDSAKFPRIVLSCMFQREPTQYLED
jgi:hypothetical protein